MRCPKCLHDDTKVLESRVSQEGRSIRRRRACLSCNYRYTTYEKQEELQLQVKKRDESFQPFVREKLIDAIQAACIKRPVSLTQIEALVATLERRLQDAGIRVVPSRQIGDLVMENLKELDQVAYVRFASIYKDFKEAEEFRAAVELLSETDQHTTPN